MAKAKTDEVAGFSIGGCWYRMQCRDKVAASLVHLSYLAGVARAPFMGMRVIHTSMLAIGRCDWLNRELADPQLRWAVSVDSDTAFNAGHLLDSFRLMQSQDIAIGCAPVRQGGTEGICNLNLFGFDERLGYRDGNYGDDSSTAEYKITRDELGKVLATGGEISSGGFGLVVFHLDWFRRNWSRVYPEVSTLVDFGGEDIEFCRSVRRRGGKVIALPIETEHHEFKP